MKLLAALICMAAFLCPSALSAEDIHEQRQTAALLARQDPSAGLAVLRDLLKNHPGDEDLLSDTILAANWAGDDPLALHLYHQNPTLQNYADAVEATARSARNVGDLTLAISLFRQARELAPDR